MTRAALAPAALLAALLAAGATAAQDYITAKGRLSDTDFHRLVACGQPPGGVCTYPLRHWPPHLRDRITLSRLSDIDPVSPVVAAEVSRAIDRALAQVNGTGAAIRISRVPDNSPALIRLSIRSRETMKMVSNERREAFVPAGLMVFEARDARTIDGAIILIDAAQPLSQIASVVLEEITQSLGLPYDISNPDYLRRSIFSQERNAVTVITGQDAEALRLHYPGGNPP